MIDIKQLTGLGLFRDASPEVLQSLAATATEISFAPEETLFLEGSAPRGWWLVLEGRVRVVRDRGPRQHVVHTEIAGGTLGEVPLFTTLNHPATGIASEPTRCALWTWRALEAAMARNPQLALRQDGCIVSRGGGRYTIADADGLRHTSSTTAT